ncbi:MAG: YIP1 family protein [Acidimicrobiia bacterium]|nr:YIP1 family protein [Acidimicrobiia bacterium]
MSDVLKRLLQAVRLERDAFIWMDFNDRATGDGLILVAVTTVLFALAAPSSLLGLVTSLGGITLIIRALIQAAFFWLVYSGLTYAISRFLLDGGGSYPTILRIVGFAYPTLLVGLATDVLITNAILSFLVGSIWFLAIVAAGVRYTADLALQKAAVAAAGGFIAWIIVQRIFAGGFLL